MRRLGLVGALSVLTVLVSLVWVSHVSASVDVDVTNLEASQKISWGLETNGPSRSIVSKPGLGWALEEADGQVYVGGKFLDVTTEGQVERQPHIARFDTDTAQFDASFRPTVNGPVLTMQSSPDGGLYIGGEFDTWNGQKVGALVKIDPSTGEVFDGWNTTIFGGFRVVKEATLEEADGMLYVVGKFSSVSTDGRIGQFRDAVRIDPTTGSVDWSWKPHVTKLTSIRGVAASHVTDTVYLVGRGTTAHNSAVGIGKTDASVETWSDFKMNVTHKFDIWDAEATEFGTVMLAGEQHATYVYDEHDNMALLQHHITNNHSGYPIHSGFSGGDFQDIERVGDYLLATCHCWSHHASANSILVYPGLINGWGTYTGFAFGVIAYDAKTGERVREFEPFMTGTDGGWDTLGASDGCLWLTGGYDSVGPPGSRRGADDLVRLCPPDHDGLDTEVGVPAAPESCVATVVGGSVRVEWPGVEDVSDYLVRRSYNGSKDWWRGTTVDTSFVDTRDSGELVYFLQSRVAEVQSERVECDFVEDADSGPAAPASCEFSGDGDGVSVSWVSVVGAGSYVVRRSVDGGRAFWRGRVTDGRRSLDDPYRAGLIQYYVQSVFPGYSLSEPVACSDGGVEPPVVLRLSAVPSCSVEASDELVRVSWPAAQAANRYILFRSVDGGSRVWRGSTPDLEFSESPQVGELQYFVRSAIDYSERSVFVECAAAEDGR